MLSKKLKSVINPELPLVFIDSLHFLNGSLDNLAKNLGENNFYHLSHKFIANVLDLSRVGFFPITIGKALENLKNFYLPKLNFIVH